MAKDYYATLEVPRTASKEEILAAYRRLARKYHPDLNPNDPQAKEKFQQVQTAFDVLNDPQKREMYDRYGPAFEHAGGPGGGQAWSGARGGPQGFDINLEDLFGGSAHGGGFADLFKQFSSRGKDAKGGKKGPARGEDVQLEITVPLATAVSGGERQIALTHADGKRETIQVKIPAGIEDGQKIRLRGQGQPSPLGGPAGDAFLTVRVAPHPHFRRTGNRLDVQVPITLVEALEGAKIDLPTPHGVIALTIPPGSSSGAKLRLKGQGVRPAKGSPGDLFAELQIVLPSGLSDSQRSELIQTLGREHPNPRRDLRW
jgi:DnaJ-class molecular chaperone